MNFDLGRLAFVAKLTKHPGVVQDSFLAGGAGLCSWAAICLEEGTNIRQSSFGALGVRAPAALMDVGTQREREQGSDQHIRRSSPKTTLLTLFVVSRLAIWLCIAQIDNFDPAGRFLVGRRFRWRVRCFCARIGSLVSFSCCSC